MIDKGDSMAGTCRYDSSDKTDVVPMGSMGMNEVPVLQKFAKKFLQIFRRCVTST